MERFGVELLALVALAAASFLLSGLFHTKRGDGSKGQETPPETPPRQRPSSEARSAAVVTPAVARDDLAAGRTEPSESATRAEVVADSPRIDKRNREGPIVLLPPLTYWIDPEWREEEEWHGDVSNLVLVVHHPATRGSIRVGQKRFIPYKPESRVSAQAALIEAANKLAESR
jgi:hypothetical protein